MIAEGDWGTKEKTTWTWFQNTTALAQLTCKVVQFISKLLLIQDMCKQQRQSLTLFEKFIARHWTSSTISVL